MKSCVSRVVVSRKFFGTGHHSEYVGPFYLLNIYNPSKPETLIFLPTVIAWL